MSSVHHLPLPSNSLRAARAVLAAGVVAGALSGCAIWPKALTWGGNDAPAPAPAAAEPLAPPPAPPVVMEEAPKPSPAPVPSSVAETITIEPQPVMKSTPVMAPPEAPSAKAAAKSKAKGKDMAAHDAGHKASAKSAAPKGNGGELVPGFYINVGLFAVPTNGTNAFRTLEKAELPVFTDVVKSKKGPLTRVRVGPYLSKDLADAAAEKIKGMKLEAVVFQR
ncbi:SPOR domain-containing protein [Rhodoferax sp.]|uniref:SPOR domain-containing protein n=1 Tax=Rhodoferax sp. TaxID=50421 RepID=UPI0025D430BD|nr:SPOR domain-containing protein [Rhodoferax sp.]